MTITSKLAKTTALTLAASVFAGGLLPIAQASAHDRGNPGIHGHNYGHWNKRSHRKFHRHYGRGNHGSRVYNKQRHHAKRKKSSKGDLIAAGVIGLAIGAIVASEANKNKRPAYKTYNQPRPQPTYRYDGYDQPHAGQRVPLDRYGNPVYNTPNYNAPTRYNEPEVITYQGSASLEPWTPGWREWCSNRYRSFNSQTGTFRGYDGLDHFCIPK